MKPFIKNICGDKTKKLEPEHHEFRFPGGNVNIQRTSNNEYWVHIALNQEQVLDEVPSLSAKGFFCDSRLDLKHEEYLKHGIPEIEHIENANHVAIRVKTL